ncbi:MAG: TetR/AcrR family transcriptional regulator [Glaciecola sp.]
MAAKKQGYHHGDLRTVLLAKAQVILKEDGIAGLSLRKLAERANVSRMAPYHHFTDKTELLCAIAQEGFSHWHKMAQDVFNRSDLSAKQKYSLFIRSYIGYAADNPELYDMMFGRAIWKQGLATADLKQEAYPCFQFQVSMTKAWQAQGLLPKEQDSLRLAQVTWATIHGMARLLIDGIYADNSHIDEMCECAVEVFCGLNEGS